jgi:hypothetical protein
VRRRGLSPSRFLIPLSYSSILGSTITVIDTSTTLTIAGLLSESGLGEMGFFELAPVGIPVAIAGLAYLQWGANQLLPQRSEAIEPLGDRRREYSASMIVEAQCALINQTVEDAGLRHLPGLFLVEIDRAGHIITPVGPDQLIEAGDRLVFAGVISTIVELQRIRGLVPTTDDEGPARVRPNIDWSKPRSPALRPWSTKVSAKRIFERFTMPRSSPCTETANALPARSARSFSKRETRC